MEKVIFILFIIFCCFFLFSIYGVIYTYINFDKLEKKYSTDGANERFSLMLKSLRNSAIGAIILFVLYFLLHKVI